MSRFLEVKDGLYLEELESMGICKWRINDMCCNDSSEYLGDYPRCKCESRADCKCFEKEDGILNGNK